MTRIVLVLSCAALTSCGTSVASPDVAASAASISALETAVVAHEGDGASTTTSEACAVEHQHYLDLARPQLARLLELSAGVDDCHRAMGHSGGPEMVSMCHSMRGELERHAQVTCGADAAANHAEAATHCRLMRNWLTRERAGLDALPSGGGMMRCTRP